MTKSDDRLGERWTCNRLEGGLVFYGSRLLACCVIHHGNRGRVVLQDDFDPDKFCIDAILETRRRILDRLQQPGGYDQCTGCILLEQRRPVPRNYPVESLNFSSSGRCNLDCTYCVHAVDRFQRSADPPRLFPLAKRLVKQGLVSPRPLVEWSGGEPTLNEEFGEMSSFFANLGARQMIFTNGLILHKAALAWIPRSLERMYISVDAGTRETYRRIKRADAFHQVWNNIAEYVKVGGGAILPKMILLDENMHEITQFVQYAEKVGAQRVVVDFDSRNEAPSAEKLEAAAVMMEECAKRGIRLVAGFHTLHSRPDCDFRAEVLRQYKARVRSRSLPERIRQRIGAATAVRHAIRVTRKLYHGTVPSTR